LVVADAVGKPAANISVRLVALVEANFIQVDLHKDIAWITT